MYQSTHIKFMNLDELILIDFRKKKNNPICMPQTVIYLFCDLTTTPLYKTNPYYYTEE